MSERIRSALFVDFDNIFIGLKQVDPRAAEEFGRSVTKWLRWIVDSMPLPPGGTVRDILVRKCYGNPETFADYRGYFTRAGFSVVDCPPLTRAGKNSADIVMVMDILDALAHPTRFDEFILMSADADFTPVVLRLRMHDRRTVAIVTGNTAAAYKASCDLVVPDDDFVDRALGLPPIPAPARAAARNGAATPVAPDALLDAVARRVYEEASGSGEISASRLPEIFREFKEFTPRSNWLGFFSLRALTEALVARRPELRLTEGGDVWSVAVEVPPAAPSGQPAAPSAGDGDELDGLRNEIIQAVRQIVRAAETPVVMARLAQLVRQAVGPRVGDTRWAGAGTFGSFLDRVEDLGLEIKRTPQDTYIYDPAVHAPPVDAPVDARPANLEGLSDEMSSFIRRVCEVTDTPRLSPHQYAALFEVIAKEVQAQPYDLTSTSRVVRDQMLERGEAVSRQYTAFVLRGITFSGYRFRRTGPREAPALARAFLANVGNLLRGAQVVLTERESELLRDWLAPSSVAEAATGSRAGESEAVEASIPAPNAAAADEHAGDQFDTGDEFDRDEQPALGAFDPPAQEDSAAAPAHASSGDERLAVEMLGGDEPVAGEPVAEDEQLAADEASVSYDASAPADEDDAADDADAAAALASADRAHIPESSHHDWSAAEPEVASAESTEFDHRYETPRAYEEPAPEPESTEYGGWTPAAIAEDDDPITPGDTSVSGDDGSWMQAAPEAEDAPADSNHPEEDTLRAWFNQWASRDEPEESVAAPNPAAIDDVPSGAGDELGAASASSDEGRSSTADASVSAPDEQAQAITPSESTADRVDVWQPDAPLESTHDDLEPWHARASANESTEHAEPWQPSASAEEAEVSGGAWQQSSDTTDSGVSADAAHPGPLEDSDDVMDDFDVSGIDDLGDLELPTLPQPEAVAESWNAAAESAADTESDPESHEVASANAEPGEETGDLPHPRGWYWDVPRPDAAQPSPQPATPVSEPAPVSETAQSGDPQPEESSAPHVPAEPVPPREETTPNAWIQWPPFRPRE